MIGVINATAHHEKDPRSVARERLVDAAAGAGLIISKKAAAVGEASPFLSLPNSRPVASAGASGSGVPTNLWRVMAVVTRRFQPKEATSGYRSVALRLWDGQSGVCEGSTSSDHVILLVLVGAAYERWFSHLTPKIAVVIGPAVGQPEVFALGGASAAAAAGGGAGSGFGQEAGIKIVVNTPGDICMLGLCDNIAVCGAKVSRSDRNDALCEMMVNKTRSPVCCRHLLQAQRDKTAAEQLARQQEDERLRKAAKARSSSSSNAKSGAASSAPAGNLLLAERDLKERIQENNARAMLSVTRNVQTHRVVAPEMLSAREQNDLRLQQVHSALSQTQRKVERHDFVNPLAARTATAAAGAASAPASSSASVPSGISLAGAPLNMRSGGSNGSAPMISLRPGSVVARTIEAAAAVSVASRRREREEEELSAAASLQKQIQPTQQQQQQQVLLQAQQREQLKMAGLKPNSLVSNKAAAAGMLASAAVLAGGVPAPAERAFAPMPSTTAAAASLRARPTTSGLAASLGFAGTNYCQRAREATSANDDLANLAVKEARDAKLAAIEQKIAVFDALDNISEVPTTGWHCVKCNRLFFSKNAGCLQKGHELVARRTVKRFWRCGQCKQGKMPSLGELAPTGVPCLQCGATAWERVSAAGGPDGNTAFEASPLGAATQAAAGGALQLKENRAAPQQQPQAAATKPPTIGGGGVVSLAAAASPPSATAAKVPVKIKMMPPAASAVGVARPAAVPPSVGAKKVLL